MTKYDYLMYAIEKGLLTNIKWYYTFLTENNKKDYRNEYIVKENNIIYLLIDGEKEILTDHISGPVYDIYYKISLTPNHFLKSVNEKINTSMGYLILNYILVEHPFEGSIPYIQKDFDIGDYEKMVGEYLSNNKITVPQYKKFVNNCGFIEKFSRIVTISATEKGITPPKGLVEFKKKTIKEFNEKYGVNWRKDTTRVVEYEKLLKAYMDDWLKDDPAYNKFISGKVKNNAMVKKYLSFGMAIGFEETGDELVQVDESLLDGFPKDKEKLSRMFNTSRSASFDRGHETQKGGATAKDILRATSSASISDKDCGVTYGKIIKVNKQIAKALVGRYIIENGKTRILETQDDVEKYMEKKITIRSPQYCKSLGSSYCPVCVGKLLSQYKTGINLVESDIGSSILNASLKKMHNSVITTVKLDIHAVMY